MGDPLSLLRQFNISKKEIIVEDDTVIFGEFSWKKNSKTNYVVHGSGKDGGQKQYYTLECLMLLLKNVELRHPDYVCLAANESIPVVRRPDRKALLAYLNGNAATAASIDRSAPLEIPTQVKRTIEQASDVAAKKQRYDENVAPKVNSLTSNTTRSLSDLMSEEKIASIKAELADRRRELSRQGGRQPAAGQQQQHHGQRERVAGQDVHTAEHRQPLREHPRAAERSPPAPRQEQRPPPTTPQEMRNMYGDIIE